MGERRSGEYRIAADDGRTLQQRRADALASVDAANPGTVYTGGELGTAGILYGNAPGRVRWLVTSLGIASIDLCAAAPIGDAVASDIVLRVRVTTLGDLAFVRYSIVAGAVVRFDDLGGVFACLRAIRGIDEVVAPVFVAGHDVVTPCGVARILSVETLDGAATLRVRPYGASDDDWARFPAEECTPC